MNPPGWPWPLLLLVLTGASTLDARLGTTVTPHSTNHSLEGKPNITALELEVEFYKHMMKKENKYRLESEACWKKFVLQMANVSMVHLCEWNIISRPYNFLRGCLEDWADYLEYGYPNALAEHYILRGHHRYFRNCTLERPLLLDPPENILLTLIITPICLIPFSVTLVVLKSKDGKMQA